MVPGWAQDRGGIAAWVRKEKPESFRVIAYELQKLQWHQHGKVVFDPENAILAAFDPANAPQVPLARLAPLNRPQRGA